MRSAYKVFQGYSYYEIQDLASYNNTSIADPSIVLEPIGKTDNKVSFRLRFLIMNADIPYARWVSGVSNLMTSNVDENGNTNAMQWRDKYGNSGTVKLTFKYPQVICDIYQTSWAETPCNYNIKHCKVNLLLDMYFETNQRSDYLRDYIMNANGEEVY